MIMCNHVNLSENFFGFMSVGFDVLLQTFQLLNVQVNIFFVLFTSFAKLLPLQHVCWFSDPCKLRHLHTQSSFLMVCGLSLGLSKFNPMYVRSFHPILEFPLQFWIYFGFNPKFIKLSESCSSWLLSWVREWERIHGRKKLKFGSNSEELESTWGINCDGNVK